jgi:hypothetical protein
VPVPDSVAVIQATLAPAFLISGTGIILNFTQTRLFRVVDRARAAARGEAVAPDLPHGLLLHRARILRNAIALGVLAVGFTVVAAILVMASELFGLDRLAGAAPYSLALAMLALLGCLGLVLWDTVLSVRSVAR